MKLNTHSSTPLYMQLKQAITEDINKGVILRVKNFQLKRICAIYTE